MKSRILFAIGSMLFLVACGVGLHYMENYEEVYYTIVDNSKIRKLSTSDDMKYVYTLNSYNSSGSIKELEFKTTRELREGAYLMLEVRTFGVHKWQEVQFEDLPQKVKDKLK